MSPVSEISEIFSFDRVIHVVTRRRLNELYIVVKYATSTVEYQCSTLKNNKPEPYCAASVEIHSSFATVILYYKMLHSKRMEDGNEK
jgi:hypothetical protein